MRIIFIISAMFFCSACSAVSSLQPSGERQQHFSIPDAVYESVDKMLSKIPADKVIDRSRPLIVSSLVNIDDLKSSRLGRTLSEQIATRLVTRGYFVKELKLRENIYIKNMEGEILLSRELPEILKKHSAQNVIAGTYSSSANNLYITVKMIDAVSGTIFSADDFILPFDSEVRSLLRNSSN